jgi:D-threonate/D-erythronate kinase
MAGVLSGHLGGSSDRVCMTDWLIIADDLTGAADCGSAFVRHGLDAVVSWGDIDPDASILAVDADSRHLPAGAAAACQVAALAAHWRPGLRLYKKIDSTLRGQPAAELAAQLSAWGAPSGRPAPLVIMAPAFPATGRVTVEGRILLHERPLEQTPLWAREHTYASAFLPDVLASAGLAAETIGLEVIRAVATAC